ncbi:MAG: hypothetical protein WBP81_23435 [Solirubrobacteraceae bacterium]
MSTTPRVNKDRNNSLRVKRRERAPAVGHGGYRVRVEVVRVQGEPPARHASEEMYGTALGAGLDADMLPMTGREPENVVDADLYRRLAGDRRATGELAIADLTWSLLRAALKRDSELLRLSLEELVRDGCPASDPLSDLVEGPAGCTRLVHGTCSPRARRRPPSWSAPTETRPSLSLPVRCSSRSRSTTTPHAGPE